MEAQHQRQGQGRTERDPAHPSDIDHHAFLSRIRANMQGPNRGADPV